MPAVATLDRKGGGASFSLRSRFLVGRSAACDLRLEEPRVSGEHATVRWTGAVWEVRDLGSKNGTFVGTRRLAAGERAPLLAGDTLAFGAAEPPAPIFVLSDASAPLPSARNAPRGVTRVASGGLIALPDEDAPAAIIVEEREGRWALEAGGTARPVADREVISVGGETWIFDLPATTSSTVDGSHVAITLDRTALRFEVSRDEERVDILVTLPDREVRLTSRSHHYLLVTLARARLAAADKPPAERGWMDRDALCRMLAIDELRLNVDVCRARKQFAALGIAGAANIVDRRTGTGRIRLGVAEIEVRREAE